MADYIPIEDISDYTTTSSELITPAVNRYQLQLTRDLQFTATGQQKSLILVNTGWDKLNCNGLIIVGTGFTLASDIPTVLLSRYTYEISVAFEGEEVGEYSGGVYVDVENAYGNKFIQLTGIIAARRGEE